MILISSAAALAQATIQQQRVVQEDVCAGIANPDASSCAQSAMWDHNWPAFLKWAQRAAAGGDYIAADWLAGEYEMGEEGLPKDLVRAYMWYDIAAQLHARKIQQMPPTPNPGYAEDNRQEINYRNGIGEKLSQDQIAVALRLEKGWFNAPTR